MGLNIKLKVAVAEGFDSAIETRIQNRIALGSQLPGASSTTSRSDLQGPFPSLSDRSGGGIGESPLRRPHPRSGSAPHLAEREEGEKRAPPTALPEGAKPSRLSTADVRDALSPPRHGLAPAKRSVAATAAREWQSAGMSPTGTAGVLANIGEESAFDPTLRHPDQPHYGGEAHYAHGLYQEGGAEWNRYSAWLDKYHPGADWRDPQLQSRFAAVNLKENYPQVWERMNRARSREEAASLYASGYLKPAERYLASRLRGFSRRGVPPVEAFTGSAPAPAPTAALKPSDDSTDTK